MQIHQVGIDNIADWEIIDVVPNALAVVYDYEAGSYEGSGYAVIRYADGWDIVNLSHCSCYGPMDRVVEGLGMRDTLDEVAASYSMDMWDRAQFDSAVESARKLIF
jgi:hypothetical protein